MIFWLPKIIQTDKLLFAHLNFKQSCLDCVYINGLIYFNSSYRKFLKSIWSDRDESINLLWRKKRVFIQQNLTIIARIKSLKKLFLFSIIIQISPLDKWLNKQKKTPNSPLPFFLCIHVNAGRHTAYLVP